MDNRKMAIYDSELSYVYLLADYFNEKKNGLFFAEAFSSAESLTKYLEENYIDILLVGDSVFDESLKSDNIKMTIIISEYELIKESSTYPAIYKYQPAKNILKQIISYYAENENEPLSVISKSCNIYGIYSPVNRSLKTSFCLALGQILAREMAVLYINLEDYSGFSTIFGKEYSTDLSDIIYYLRQENSNILVKLESMVETVNNLDYIPPAVSPSDIRDVSKDEWQKLITKLSTSSRYEAIIIDFGDGVDGLIELLMNCDRIYMPIREDYISLAKIEQFERLLKLKGYDNSQELIKKIKLPYHNSFGSRECYAEQLLWSEIGDFAREYAK